MLKERGRWDQSRKYFCGWAGGSKKVPTVEMASSTETQFSFRGQRYFEEPVLLSLTRERRRCGEPNHGTIH